MVVVFLWQRPVVEVGPVAPSVADDELLVVGEPVWLDLGRDPVLEAVALGPLPVEEAVLVEGHGLSLVDDDDSVGGDGAVDVPLQRAEDDVDLAAVVVVASVADQLGRVGRSGF